MRGNGIIIPDILKKRVIELVHEKHQGIMRTKIAKDPMYGGLKSTKWLKIKFKKIATHVRE